MVQKPRGRTIRFKLNAMTSNTRKVGRFSKTKMRYDIQGNNDYLGTDAHSF